MTRIDVAGFNHASAGLPSDGAFALDTRRAYCAVMTMTPPIAATAVAAWSWIGLYAGLQAADSLWQRAATGSAKAIPGDDRLAAGAHPWTGWMACTRHAAVVAVTQAGFLAVMSLAAPFTIRGVLAALTVSASTHAVVDLRWLVRAIVRATQCHDCGQGPRLVDQALHHCLHVPAAILAATVTTTAGVTVTVAAGIALVAAALLGETWWARSAVTRVGDPDRM